MKDGDQRPGVEANEAVMVSDNMLPCASDAFVWLFLLVRALSAVLIRLLVAAPRILQWLSHSDD